MKIEKDVLSVKTQTKKEAIKMIKKCLAITLIALIAAFNVVPAQAYTSIGGAGVTVTASGTITSNTITFTTSVVDQAAGTDAGTTLNFPANPVGRVNSGKALKMTGGTNAVGARIIIATNNDSLFTVSDQDPRGIRSGATFSKYSGIDGAGMVGASNQGYVVPLIWGMTDTPNTRPAAYTFSAPNASGHANWSYVVDEFHKFSFVPTADGITPSDSTLDTLALYRKGSTTPETNTAREGSGNYNYLYPQYWDVDLYNSATNQTTSTKVSPALYSSIATVAYSIQVGTDTNAGYYICQVPKLSTVDDSTDSITAKLAKTDGTTGEFIYVPIGADFTGAPAQVYSTSKLLVMMVQD